MPKAAIVTGASGGIGRAAAEALAPDHDVLVHYNSSHEDAEATADAVEAAGGGAVTHGCDVSDPDAAEEMVEVALDAFGRLDVLVNNAGVFFATDLDSITVEQIETTVDVNLLGTIYCAKAALPSLREQEESRIVNISSNAGTRGSPTDPAYGASKGGVLAFTKSLAKQYTQFGVFSNAVAPGPTDTPMFAEDRRPAVREASPIGRLVTPEEVAEAIRFFATTTSVSGRTLTVNGGNEV